MTIQLQEGVQLHVLPTTKYKTIRMMVRFRAPLDEKTVTKRTLLANLMETNSRDYPTQTELSAALADLYGANFGIGINKKGTQHWFSATMNITNGSYVSEPTLLEQAVTFLGKVLFAPNMTAGVFDEKTFQREKDNLRAYLESLSEDKQTYALLKLQELYFADEPTQQIPSFGTPELLAQETPATLGAYYQQMMAEDQVDILVIGDVTTKEVQKAFEKLPFAPRPRREETIFYDAPVRNIIREAAERQDTTQSKLDLAYTTDIYYGTPEYFALQVFNGLFGGFAHSKLFMNVREKESMAYYASSSADTFRGLLLVQTGIDGKNRNKVLHLIAQELEQIRLGKITDLEFEQTKAMLLNQYLLGEDSAPNTLEKAYLNDLLPHTQLTAAEWAGRLEAVTKQDVVKVAQEVHLQAIYFLEGKQDA